MVNESWIQYLEIKRKCSNKILATKSTKRPCINRRTMSVRKVLYTVYYTIYGPAIQVALLKGKCDTA